ncbi:aminoacyl-tRNA hydrolase [Sinanaerobacter sp. ZZT-01]|uniref:aminoacyl-tRNA hydrolase n=1 Tax=Sinanaerobacter sp. ZZT-01 TaxID=3111540 RepID=UPI002D782572|nr:aminoacyl-tRNA hydrolase [Sinanaerobacter sp. ZZT-01]WRR92215.1 aminoacyl-tRNA hydrolase [Sinanaerobacter sp. ZZT-01]
MYIIVGLGNPGKQYENTRHNIGFITIEQLAQKHGISVTKLKHKALVGEGRISDQKVLLVKPQTYMNLSGNSVREIIEYYKEDITNLVVIYDDIDIPTGTVRIRKKGSAGTHNGMRSILYDIQSDQFPRIRIGIGGERKMPLDRYVIGGFTKEEKPLMEEAVITAVQAVECMLQKGIDKAMNEYNVKPRKEGDQE